MNGKNDEIARNLLKKVELRSGHSVCSTLFIFVATHVSSESIGLFFFKFKFIRWLIIGAEIVFKTFYPIYLFFVRKKIDLQSNRLTIIEAHNVWVMIPKDIVL